MYKAFLTLFFEMFSIRFFSLHCLPGKGRIDKLPKMGQVCNRNIKFVYDKALVKFTSTVNIGKFVEDSKVIC